MSEKGILIEERDNILELHKKKWYEEKDFKVGAAGRGSLSDGK